MSPAEPLATPPGASPVRVTAAGPSTGRRITAVLVAVVAAAAVGLAAGAARGEQFWVAAVVFALCTLPVFAGLGWAVLVSPPGADAEVHAEENVERRWLATAQEGAFLDLLTTAGVALVAVSVSGLQVGAVPVLTGIVLLAMVDVVVRYRLIARRES